MYISEREWHAKGIQNVTSFYSATPVVFPPSSTFDGALRQIQAERNLDINLGKAITRIDKESSTAFFVDADGNEHEKEYDFLHVVP